MLDMFLNRCKKFTSWTIAPLAVKASATLCAIFSPLKQEKTDHPFARVATNQHLSFVSADFGELLVQIHVCRAGSAVHWFKYPSLGDGSPTRRRKEISMHLIYGPHNGALRCILLHATANRSTL